jgi:hypothetical protein
MAGGLIFLSAMVARTTHPNVTLHPIASAQAQQLDHSTHSAVTHVATNGEPLVDGSVQPELIPDDVAIRALMQTLRVPAEPDAADLKELRSRLDRVSLNNADMQVVVRALGIFDARAQEQEIRMNAVRPSDAVSAGRNVIARYQQERSNLDALIMDHYLRLLASMSPEGEAKLRAHLRHVKSRIKIYPMPDLPAKIN